MKSKNESRMYSLLPYWFKKDVSILSIIGNEMDSLENTLLYAYEQTNLQTIDVDSIDLIYVAIIPTNISVMDIKYIIGESFRLERKFKIKDFLNVNNSDNYNDDCYIIDEDRNVIFFRKKYNSDENNENGFVFIKNKSILSRVDLSPHHLWGFLDEFGALLGVYRLSGESNHNYKNRIEDVFKHKANSTKFGVANGVARELNLRKRITWNDTKEELVIKDKMIIINSITIDDNQVIEDDFYINTDGNVVIKPILNSKSVEVSYIYGLELNSLNTSSSNSFSNSIYKSNGEPTYKLKEYINDIERESLILWDSFRYDEALWVKESEDDISNSYSYIRAFSDSNIKGFSKYGFFKNDE